MLAHRITLATLTASLLPWAAFAAGVKPPAPPAKPAAPVGKVDFSRDIQPMLKVHCFQCHSGAQKQGGLLLDSRAVMLKGGDSGAAVLPGQSAKSPLLERVLGHGGLPRMPLGFAPLSAEKVSLLRAWIDQGANWSEAKAPATHWAYVKPVLPRVPKVKNAAWVRNPIDAFILARLEKEGLKPSPEADRVTLLRRVTLDLTGLPPTPKEVDAFLADRSPDAYEKVVDRLLANPHYGERMALPWLDTARYADSNGFQQDGDTYQYVWRDWVVQSLNEDLPFDQFTVQQLAGDLVVQEELKKRGMPDTVTSTTRLPADLMKVEIASGFNRLHLLNGEGGAIPEEQRNVILFDRVDVTATTWLGATLACAQCHDHKYDPLSQKDYYQFMAFFNNVPETGTPPFGGQYRIADPWIYAGTDEQMAKLKAFDDQIAAAKGDAEKVKALEKERDAFKPEVPRVMIMSDARPRKTHLLLRGNYEAPGEEVQANTPGKLPPMPADYPKNRLGLARWLVSPEHPLTSRVQVNRYWQQFFGQGLVKTSENLGTQCDAPSHPELLDWLAVTFMSKDARTDSASPTPNLQPLTPNPYACGWSMKKLTRLLVTSATYRQSSKVTPQLRQSDPENRLLARAARFRLPSLLLRDVALSTSGLLDPRIGGKPVYPYQPKGIWDGLSITKERDFTYPQSKGSDLFRRSLYTFWRRTVAPANMFDASVRNTCKVRLSTTSTPLHALTTLNDMTWVEAGRALAERVMKEAGPSPDARLTEAFRRVCARRPTPQDQQILRRALSRALAAYRADPKAAEAYLKTGESPRDTTLDPVQHAAYANVCLAIYNLDEALNRE